MPKFRKKPVVIEARRFDQIGITDQEVLADWCNGKLAGIKLGPTDRIILIQTREGEMTANHGDWIIKGIKGEFYPCKPDIFTATYEPVDA